MKKRECLIFDLRNNTGRDGALVDEWFRIYTGKKLLPNYSTLRIRPVWISSAEEINFLFFMNYSGSVIVRFRLVITVEKN